MFGYSKDEAQAGDPRLREHGYGIFEVRNSPWPGRLHDYNRQAFPTRTINWSLRQFVIACHESMGEFLAADIRVEIWSGPFDGAVTEVLGRLVD